MLKPPTTEPVHTPQVKLFPCLSLPVLEQVFTHHETLHEISMTLRASANNASNNTCIFNPPKITTPTYLQLNNPDPLALSSLYNQFIVYGLHC